jgi:hypothetical protein
VFVRDTEGTAAGGAVHRRAGSGTGDSEQLATIPAEELNRHRAPWSKDDKDVQRSLAESEWNVLDSGEN